MSVLPIHLPHKPERSKSHSCLWLSLSPPSIGQLNKTRKRERKKGWLKGENIERRRKQRSEKEKAGVQRKVPDKDVS